METLSIVAYQQPITRAALEQVRGVSCDGPLKSLLEKKLIALGARAETVGNPYTYVTTDDFLKYFGINSMPIVTSQYWNQVHGNRPEEVLRDEEGMQTMRTLGENMAWLLKCIEAGRQAGVLPPQYEPVVKTNFIR